MVIDDLRARYLSRHNFGTCVKQYLLDNFALKGYEWLWISVVAVFTVKA